MKRCYAKFDEKSFKADLKQCLRKGVNGSYAKSHLSDLVRSYSSVSVVLDKHAPKITKKAKERKPTPWLKSDIASGKKLKRKLEKRRQKYGLGVDFLAYKRQRNRYNA